VKRTCQHIIVYINVLCQSWGREFTGKTYVYYVDVPSTTFIKLIVSHPLGISSSVSSSKVNCT